MGDFRRCCGCDMSNVVVGNGLVGMSLWRRFNEDVVAVIDNGVDEGEIADDKDVATASLDVVRWRCNAGTLIIVKE